MIMKMHSAGILIEEEGSELLSSVNGRFDSSEVHVRMLNDRARTSAYQRAIRETVCPGDIVLDIGTGTGILAATAAKCGAARVYAVEQSSMAKLATKVFEENGLSETVTVIQGHSTDIVLPEKADVLVAEILGNDPLQENILDVTSDAVRRHLKPDAKIIPRHVTMCASLLSIPKDKLNKQIFNDENVSSWYDWYGISFKPLVRASQAQSHCFNVNSYRTLNWKKISDPVNIMTIDLMNTAPTSVKEKCSGVALNSGEINGVLVYFSASLSDGCHLSIAPEVTDESNSWSSYVWLPGIPVVMNKGEQFELQYRFQGNGSEFEISKVSALV